MEMKEIYITFKVTLLVTSKVTLNLKIEEIGWKIGRDRSSIRSSNLTFFQSDLPLLHRSFNNNYSDQSSIDLVYIFVKKSSFRSNLFQNFPFAPLPIPPIPLKIVDLCRSDRSALAPIPMPANALFYFQAELNLTPTSTIND